LIFKKSRKAKAEAKSVAQPVDEEKAMGNEPASSGSSNTIVNRTTSGNGTEEETLQSLAKSDSVFTWRNVEYTVPYRGGERKLLNGVSGYAKPGKMVALVGASGAGKTTLLNTLSQRQRVGVVTGEMLVDGNGLGRSFQRGTGFCEQMDLHDGTATIREALEFSAILRQDKEIPRKEKIEYVDKIIELLELEEIQDAVVMSLGVEQRKRLTIGVELAAKPSLLLFLDEPTSGLDSNSAFSIVRFLKKLAMAGQGQSSALLCSHI
jgi:ABC-type multidrug transport system ATPase subunit